MDRGAITILLTMVTVLTQCCPAQAYDRTLVNNVGDFILKNLKIFNPSSFPLGNKTRSFALNSAEIETNLGAISDFKTLRRDGDIELEFGEDSVTVTFRFRLDVLRVRYEEYEVRLFGAVTSTGVLEISFRDNLMMISVDMGHKSLCFLTITKLEILELEDIDLHFYEHGSQELSYWKSKLLSPVVRMFTDNIKESVQKKLRKKLPRIIKPNKYLCGDDELSVEPT